jgi:serine/threonine protein kinase
VIDRNTSRPQVPGHRVESVLGRGASGTVWQGRDAMGRAVAIKVPHELGWLADEEATRTEAHVLMAVRHEHLVTLRDVVTMADDRVALVFDLVTGASLGGTVGARGRLRPGETVTVVTPLCEAVEALHGAGGLHGDVSPSNVMLTAAGKPLLLDLGAARLAAGPVDAPVHGTPGFVAPEVRQGFAPTGRRRHPQSCGSPAGRRRRCLHRPGPCPAPVGRGGGPPLLRRGPSRGGRGRRRCGRCVGAHPPAPRGGSGRGGASGERSLEGPVEPSARPDPADSASKHRSDGAGEQPETDATGRRPGTRRPGTRPSAGLAGRVGAIERVRSGE